MVGGEDGVLRCFLDVETGGEGFVAGAGEDDCAGGGGGGEVGEEGGKFMPHFFFERIHLFRAVDLDVGDEGEGVGEVEVFACWGS